MKYSLLALWGLFFPYKDQGRWIFTLQVGRVPLGWIMVVIAIIVKAI